MNAFDANLPAGFNDADLEMHEITLAAHNISRLKKKGICTHGWYFAPAGHRAHCKECNADFESEAALLLDAETAFAKG